MANVSNYGLIGVGPNLKFSKGGVNLNTNGSTTFTLKRSDNSTDAALNLGALTSSAGNVTLTTGNVVLSSNTGVVTIGDAGNFGRAGTGVYSLSGTGALVVPSGTTGQEPTATSYPGGFRYNTTGGTMEYSNGTAWVTMATGGTAMTAVSVNTANGLAGTSSGGTTPSLTLSTTVTGILKGNGTAISAAVSGTDLKTVGGNTIIGSGDAGTIGVGYGGTGLTSLTTNGVVFGNGGSNAGVTAAGTQYQVLQAGVADVPTFDAIHLDQAAAVTGVLPASHGGTGVSNLDTSTITLGGALTISGAYTSAFSLTGNTAVTFPTSGTLLSTANIATSAVTSFQTSLSGLTPSSSAQGAVTLAGTLGVASGGTGVTTLATNGVVIGAGTGPVTTQTGTYGQVLVANVSNVPTFSALNLASAATVGSSILPLANGGTNNANTGSNGSIMYNNGSAIVNSSVGTNNQALISTGAGAPTWITVASSISTNEIIQGNGSGGFTALHGTFTGTGLTSGVTLNGTVSQPTDATTKAYVDAATTGLNVHASCETAVINLALDTQFASAVYNHVAQASPGGVGDTITAAANGALPPVGGYTLAAIGQRVLVNCYTVTPAAGGADWTANGIYTVSSLGSGGSPWILIRATDYNNSVAGQVTAGDFTFVTEGTSGGTGWTQTAVGTYTNDVTNIGTDSIVFTQFSGAGSYTAGVGLTLTGGTVFSANTDSVTTYIDGSNKIAVKSSAVLDQVLLSTGASNTPTWGALPLSNSNAVTGTLPAVNGGTGQSSYTVGDILYASGATALSKLAGVATGNVLLSGGVGVAPTYGKVNLTTTVSGILPSANGGTGVNNAYNITLGGAINTGGAFTTTPANDVTFTTTGATNVTLPTSGTLATVGGTVASFSTGTTGLTPVGPATGAVVLGGTLVVANGGTGLASVTAGQVLYGAGTSPLANSANFTFDGTSTLTVGGADPLSINGATATIASTGSNSDINLIPNGTGSVVIGPVGAGLIQSDPSQPLTVRGNTVLTLTSVTGNTTMALPVGSYVDVSGPTAAQYATAIASAPTALVNKYYVDQQVGDISGDVKAVQAVVPLNANGTTNIGSLLPAGVTVLSVKVNVTVADTAATLSVGKTASVAAYMTTAENDPQTVGMYLAEDMINEAGAVQIFATVAATAATSGSSCQVVVTYQIN